MTHTFQFIAGASPAYTMNANDLAPIDFAVSQSTAETSLLDSPSTAQNSRPQRWSRPRTRSKNGCWTCRQRKVKCDEKRPRCSPCIRLGKECQYDCQWNFHDLNLWVKERYDHITATGSSPWNQRSCSLDSETRAADLSKEIRSMSRGWAQDYDQRREFLGTSTWFNFILTPDSFAGLPEYRGLGQCDRMDSSGSGTSQDQPIDDLGSAMLLEAVYSPQSESSLAPLRQGNHVTQDSASARYTASVFREPSYNSKPNPEEHALYFETFILPRILFFGTARNDCVNIEVFEKGGAGFRHFKSFEPLLRDDTTPHIPDLTSSKLYHAILALSSLSLALGGRQDLFIEALQHYDWAISACFSCDQPEPSLLFYLHFVLLIFDICSTEQNTHGSPSMWSQQLRHLGRLAGCIQQSSIESVQPKMLWSVLFLDTQSCLAGNYDAGSCVRAYLANDFLLPDLTQLQLFRDESDQSASVAVYGLASYSCRKLAELSQLALRMRREVKEGIGSAAEHRRSIDKFHNVLSTEWTTKNEEMLNQNSDGSGIDESASTILEFALLQYLTCTVYLHTSMYPGQRTHSPRLERQIARHCTEILSIASARDSDQRHTYFPLFLAGYASKCTREKKRALELMKKPQAKEFSGNSARIISLLQLIHEEQAAELDLSWETALDWVEFSSQVGINIVTFNL
ncbi:hypothetical protein D6C85_08760 [Aureobasidium pullulans]|uniref:Zn(2)-C6 fungal-type domain-containing protein n=1 Tax=Aureobasidium pullulans TaxID=5580 RepID=A0A4S9WGD6_AURPU|nr:hypothetical protein D6C85_08760 [Aureobasidium pullulans]